MVLFNTPTMKDSAGSSPTPPLHRDGNESTIASSFAVHRILVISPHPDAGQQLSKLLVGHGYSVSQVAGSKMALAAIQAERPDVIFLAIALPHMNGYEICHILKNDETFQAIPVIFLVEAEADLDRRRIFQFDGTDYVTLPFEPAEVLARIQHHLALRQQQQMVEQIVQLVQEQETLQETLDQIQAENQALQRRHPVSPDQAQHFSKGNTAPSSLSDEAVDRYLKERERVEATLRETEERYRSIFENAIEGIFQSLPNRRYLQVNPAMAKIYGYSSPAEVVESVTDISTLYVQPKRYAELTTYVQSYNELSEFESEVYRKDGSTIWVSENIRAVRDSAGKILYFEGSVTDITERRQAEEELRRQRLMAERLLLNVLPQKIAERLKRGQKSIADSFTNVSVLFADLVDFTQLASQMPPQELVSLLNQVFSQFDQLIERYKIEKVKTIGDAYMAVSGMPSPNPLHAEAIANLALDMQTVIQQYQSPLGDPFQLRIGIHTGSVIAGVIGTKKFSYDLWGDTVNVASRMESQGEAGRIQVTEEIYRLLKDRYMLLPRGAIAIKGKGLMTTYWLMGRQFES
jgi:adenylate cyclase